MNQWLLLWLFASVLEGASLLAINRFICDYKAVRAVLWPAVLGLGALTTAFLVGSDWRVYAFLGVVQLYRLLNVARVMKWRLQRRRLQNSSFRTFVWLVALQLVGTGLSLVLVRTATLQGFLYGLGVAVVLVLGVLLRTTALTWQRTKPKELVTYPSDSQLPAVSVLVPARNETEVLQQCLESIVASDYPKLEVIVLDDCSVTKRTPEIIRDFAHEGVRFVAGKEPEERWLPKNWAYQRLYEESSSEILLFCGVDTRFDPSTIRTLVAHFTMEKRRMMSVMPQRIVADRARFSLLQPMRYFWELCLPRRIFKRPPVLSTCWMIERDFLDQCGRFEAVANSITPEAHFARQAVTSDTYLFLRSNRYLPIFSAKTQDAQYQTTLRVRYPQLHKRIELVALTALFELLCFVWPFLGVVYAVVTVDYILLALMLVACSLVVSLYAVVSVKTGLCKPVYGVASTFLAYVVDIVVLHVSCLQYEFGAVTWKGRNVCLPVMQVIPRLPKLPDA